MVTEKLTLTTEEAFIMAFDLSEARKIVRSFLGQGKAVFVNAPNRSKGLKVLLEQVSGQFRPESFFFSSEAIITLIMLALKNEEKEMSVVVRTDYPKDPLGRRQCRFDEIIIDLSRPEPSLETTFIKFDFLE